MTNIKTIYELIDKFAPFELQDSWDNSGILVNLPDDREIKKILLSLDITAEVAKEAVSKSVDLVISHHPVIFQPLKSLEPDGPASILLKNGIGAISAHTNLDISHEGINAILAKKLGFNILENCVEFVKYFGHNQEKYGYGIICDTANEYSPKSLATLVKTMLGCKNIRFNDCGKKIHKVAICSGSGGSLLQIAKKCDVQALITGDVKHDVFIDAKNLDIAVIDAGHFYTENVVCELIKQRITGVYSNIDVQIADEDKDPVLYI
ncbi:MAG: Nif3-like dinuclear metal center hexameric protein [Oscillospiraceae bacterium]